MQNLAGTTTVGMNGTSMTTVAKGEDYILYIDDDADDRDNFRYALEQFNIEICLKTAVDADDAIMKLASREKPRCIYLDINMPKINGLQLLKTLKADSDLAPIPVIIFSTAINIRSREEALHLGAADVVQKPSSLQGLLSHLRKSISTHFHVKPFPIARYHAKESVQLKQGEAQ